MFLIMILSVLFGGLVGPGAVANDVAWLDLTPLFSYKDISTICSTSQFPTTLYFGAEVEGSKTIRAVLTNTAVSSIANRIAFLPEDLSGITFHQDKFSRLWLKNLTLSARLLDWVFKNAGGPLFSCKPTQPLKTVFPAPFVFTFNVEGLGESVVYSESQQGKFKGQRKDGAAYVATLQLWQKQFDSGLDGERQLLFGVLPWTRTNDPRTSPVFADRQDCRAIALNNAGLCKGQDCRGVLYHSLGFCRSNDCRAIVRGLASQCQTRDCMAVVYKNPGFCESFNCRAILYGNPGLCR